MVVSGCANWGERSKTDLLLETSKHKLAKVTESARAIVIEVDFHPILSHNLNADRSESLWQWVDEMVIEPSRRSELLANGLRFGKVLREDQFQKQLANLAGKNDVFDQFLGEVDVASDVSSGNRRIPLRMSTRHELALNRPVAGPDIAMIRRQGLTEGKTLLGPQYLLAITPHPSATQSQVKLHLRPEIQHGEMKQKWVSSDSALRIDTRRETWSLDHLDMEFGASEGDLFVLAGTLPAVGLGKAMLSGDAADQTEKQVVLLIKLQRLPQ